MPDEYSGREDLPCLKKPYATEETDRLLKEMGEGLDRLKKLDQEDEEHNKEQSRLVKLLVKLLEKKCGIYRTMLREVIDNRKCSCYKVNFGEPCQRCKTAYEEAEKLLKELK